MTTVGIIGFGGIGRRIAGRLAAGRSAAEGSAADAAAAGGPAADAAVPRLVAYLVRPGQVEAAEAALGPGVVCREPDALIGRRPDVVVEAASPASLVALGPRILAAGSDLMPLSLAAFADREAEARLVAAAEAGPGRLEIPAGAVASLDFLAAAREDMLAAVTVRACFPVSRLRGTRAATFADLDAVTERRTIFRGSVRELATGFTRRVNVTVAVALAGLGLDRTRAELIADPALNQATFEVEASAGPGAVRLVVGARDVPLGADPVDYTAFSVMRLLRRRVARIMI